MKKNIALLALACTAISVTVSAYQPYQNYHSYPENQFYRGEDAPYPIYHQQPQDNSYFYQDDSSMGQQYYYNQSPNQNQYYQNDNSWQQSSPINPSNRGFYRVDTNLLDSPRKVSDAYGSSTDYPATSYGTQNPTSTYGTPSTSNPNQIPTYGTQTNPSYKTQTQTYRSGSYYGTQDQPAQNYSYDKRSDSMQQSRYYSSQTESTTTDNAYPQDIAATPADAQLNSKIRDKTSRGWLWNSYKNVRLNTNNGIVTLEGTVGSRDDQQKLVNEIKKVEGVRSVNNRLAVK